MTYTKPEVVVLGYAVEAISTQSGKGGDDLEAVCTPPTDTVSAYEVDE